MKRKPMSIAMLSDRRRELEQIVEHHAGEGRDYMSMTRVIEELILKEHKRLKLPVGGE